MNLRKIYVLGVMMLQFAASSCTKIDNYDTPHMLEGFTGIVKVTPGIKGITANTYSPGLIFFNSNKTGTKTVMYGPGTSNFSLYTILPDDQETKTKFRDHMELQGVNTMDKLDFSGFRGRVDPTDHSLKIYEFGSQSDGMKLFKWKVEGTGLIDGPDSHVVIKISTTVGVLQELMPDELLKKLAADDTDVSLAEIEDKDMVVYLAEIDVLGENITPF